jgi:serine/threonine protein kinase
MALEVTNRLLSRNQSKAEDGNWLSAFFLSKEPATLSEVIGTLVKNNSNSVIRAIQQEKAICDLQVTLLIEIFKKAISSQKTELAAKKPKEELVLEKVVSCFEVLKKHPLSREKLKDFQALRMALFVGCKSDEISKVAKTVFTETAGKYDPAEHEKFPYNLKFSLQEKKMYVLTKYYVEDGTSKVANIALQLGFGENYEPATPELAVQLVTHPTSSHSASYLKKVFEEELSITQDLQGEQSIVTLYSGSVVPEGDSFQMEMLQEACDQDFVTVFEQKKPFAFSFTEKAVIAIDCITAVDAVHKKRYVHADIKPGNFLLKNKRAKLCDFGRTISLEKLSERTPTNVRIGYHITTAYTSPELLGCFNDFAGDYSKTDDFALGIVLWELFAEESVPWENEVEEIVELKVNFSGSNVVTFKEQLKQKQKKFEEQITEHTSTFIAALFTKDPDCKLGKALQVVAKLMSPEQQRITLPDALEAFANIGKS